MSADERRRLGAVYDAMDLHEYRRALKLIAAQLKPGRQLSVYASQILRSLKAVAFDRTGKCAEALQLCEEICAESVHDVSVLTTVAIVHRAQGLPERSTAMYEKALVDIGASDAERSFEVLDALFESYLRLENFVKAQQTSMKMFKFVPCEKYMYWAITCLYMQAISTSPNTVTSMRPEDMQLGAAALPLLKLASSMAARHVKQTPETPSSEALRMELMALSAIQSCGSTSTEDTASAADAYIHILCTDAASRGFIESERKLLLAEQHMRMGRHADAATLYTAILEANHDDWGAYLGLMDASDAMSTAEEASRPHDMDGADDVVRDVIADMEGRCTRKGKIIMRGPLLAHVEKMYRNLVCGRHADTRTSNGGDYGQKSMELAKALIAYIRYVGNRECCCTDLRKYLVTLVDDRSGDVQLGDNSGDAVRWFATELADITPSTSTATESEGQMRRRTALYEVDAACSFKISSETMKGVQPVHVLAAMLDDFEASLPLRRSIDFRESGPCDRTLVSAVEYILSEHIVVASSSSSSSSRDPIVRSCTREKLIAAASILEAGVKESPTSAVLKLPLVKAYALLGAREQAERTWDSLDIKQIQLDSMTYLLVPHHLPLWSDHVKGVLESIIKYHKAHARDAYQTIMIAFHQMNYTQVPDFFSFKNRLQMSFAYLQARVELSIMETLQTVRGHTRATSRAAPDTLDADVIASQAVDIASKHLGGMVANSSDDECPGVGTESLEGVVDNSDFEPCPTWFRHRCGSHIRGVDDIWWSNRGCSASEAIMDLKEYAKRRFLFATVLGDLARAVASTSASTAPVSSAEASTLLDTCEATCRKFEALINAQREDLSSTPMDSHTYLQLKLAKVVRAVVRVANVRRKTRIETNPSDGDASPSDAEGGRKDTLDIEMEGYISTVLTDFRELFETFVSSLTDAVPAAPSSISSLGEYAHSGHLSRLSTLANEAALMLVFVLVMSVKLLLPGSRSRRRRRKTAENDQHTTSIRECFKQVAESVAAGVDALSPALDVLASSLDREASLVVGTDSEAAHEADDDAASAMLAGAPTLFRESMVDVRRGVATSQRDLLHSVVVKLAALRDSCQAICSSES